MKVAITGSSGFIGRWVTQGLFEQGHEVWALGRDRDFLKRIFGKGVICVPTTYNEEEIRKIFNEVDIVLHLAARNPYGKEPKESEYYFKENVKITEAVITSACQSGVKGIALASSISVYHPSSHTPFSEDERTLSNSPYSRSKVLCEEIANHWGIKSGIPIASFRLAKVFGVGDTKRDAYLPLAFINKALKKETLEIWGSGQGARDLIYGKDVVELFLQFVSNCDLDGIYNAGSGKSISFIDMAEMINTVFDNKNNLKFLPGEKADEKKTYMDCSKIDKKWNWKPKWSFKDGLKDMMKFYAEENVI